MSKSNYEVFEKYLKEGDFTVLILKIPLNEVEDKLAYFVRDKGKISRSFFEDYVIATTVANINQLLHHLNQQIEDPPDLIKLREELMDLIIEINPSFDPDNLIINRNSVIKIKKKKELEDGEKMLKDNKYWELSYYEDVNKPSEDSNEKCKDEKLAAIDKKIKDSDKKDKKSSGKIKKIDELEFITHQVWWKRIGQYVTVKQFNPNDAESILKQRYFHNRTSFETFIVSVCIVDFEELFSRLDSMGIPARVAPPILMHELYQLCYKTNSFLTFTNAQELVDDGADTPSQTDKFDGRSQRWKKSGDRMADYVKQKQKKGFKDVPKEDLLNLSDNMKIFLIGQDKAVDNMVEAIQRASVGLKDPVKPIGSFLFAGQTGVGKTLATKVLANELIKDKDNIVTIDCSEYSSDHEYSKLIGAPSGYIGHEAGGVLTNAVAKNPFSVVVFDEVEKASYKVHELLLQILEEGRLTDGKGRTVPFSETIVIMTSNVGVKEINAIGKTIGFGDVAKMTEKKKGHALDSALRKKFKPEFLNRIDSIVYFRSLDKKDYMRIIDIELYKLNNNLRHNKTGYENLELKFDKKIKNLIYKEGIDERYGARPLKRAIEKSVATPLAKKLLSDAVDKKSIVNTSVVKNKVFFKIEKKIDDAPFYMSGEYKELEKESNKRIGK